MTIFWHSDPSYIEPRQPSHLLNRMLDHITPTYQALFRRLPGTERAVLSILADCHEAQLTHFAMLCRMEVRQVSMCLSRLKAKGHVDNPRRGSWRVLDPWLVMWRRFSNHRGTPILIEMPDEEALIKGFKEVHGERLFKSFMHHHHQMTDGETYA